MNRILTQKEWKQSVAEAFSAAVESTYKSMIDEAVRQEREACARVCDELAAQDKLSNYYAVAAKAIRTRRNT